MIGHEESILEKPYWIIETEKARREVDSLRDRNRILETAHGQLQRTLDERCARVEELERLNTDAEARVAGGLDAFNGLLTRAERAEAELVQAKCLAKRLDEARAQLPDWEKLWAEEKDRAERAEASMALLVKALERINRRTSPGSRTLDDFMADMGWVCDEARRALKPVSDAKHDDAEEK